MVRLILFLIGIAVAALAVAWVSEQSGGITLVWDRWRVETSLPVFMAALTALVFTVMLGWALLRALWRLPRRARQSRQRRRHARGRRAITHGLLAIGTGDTAVARKNARLARQLAQDDPLTLLLDAQTAQLSGDSAAARQAFSAMARRDDTRLLGLRGLFIEAQRQGDAAAAVQVAEQALALAPASDWASRAMLGVRCAQGDWAGALAILDAHQVAGAVDKGQHRRRRAVLLTAQAQHLEQSDRDRARTLAFEANKLAPDLVPAATLASRFLSEAHQIRKAMRVLESAWRQHPHPDLAAAYAHVRLGDSARERLARIESLAAKVPGHLESALALARAALEAGEFAKARAAIKDLVQAPTQRAALLMAEIERAEHGDGGLARHWTARALRATPDPAWTADGYVSEQWRPFSPHTGQIDAFRWIAPVAALPSEGPPAVDLPPLAADLPALESPPKLAPAPAMAAIPPAEPAPLLRRPAAPAAPSAPVVALTRVPDDPGVDDVDADPEALETEQGSRLPGWRRTLARWVG